MSKNVQIPLSLFIELLDFFSQEPEQIRQGFRSDLIKDELTDKFNKLVNHALYTKLKRAPSPEDYQKALKEYLDHKHLEG